MGLISPLVAANTADTRSTSSGGGASDTKGRVSVVARGRAVRSGRGMIACDVDHRIQFLLARAWCDDLAEHCLAAGIMQRGIEVDGAAPPFCPKPPASKALGQFGDIALRVASVDSEGVQFEQLAGIVFVGLVAGSGLLVFLAVEVDEHCRRCCRGADQISEPAQRVGPDDLALVSGFQVDTVAFFEVDVEVLAPEFDHYFE